MSGRALAPTRAQRGSTPWRTPKQLAERWGVSVRRVMRAAEVGLLPYLRVGRYIRFRVDLMPDTAPAIPRKNRTKPTTPAESGVYLLYLEGSLTYIGRSTWLQNRLRTHKSSGRRFDEVRVIPCDGETSDWLEAELIRTLQPPENIQRFARRASRAEASLGALCEQ